MHHSDREFRIGCGQSRELRRHELFYLVTAIYGPAVNGYAHSAGLFDTAVR